MIPVIAHTNTKYPAFQAEGNAMKFALPFAKEVCYGHGVDVGCNRKEWAFVDKNGVPSLMVDPAIDGCEYDALRFPPGKYDYVCSSHCIEHLLSWVDALDYWHTKLNPGGVLFLYLPDYSQTYWRIWSNRKHIHTLFPALLKDYLTERGWANIFVSGVDLNSSFMCMAEKV